MPTTERVHFRLINTPCCGHNLCWVNPRIPTFCPECGEAMYLKYRNSEHILFTDPNCTITWEATP